MVRKCVSCEAGTKLLNIICMNFRHQSPPSVLTLPGRYHSAKTTQESRSASDSGLNPKQGSMPRLHVSSEGSDRNAANASQEFKGLTVVFYSNQRGVLQLRPNPERNICTPYSRSPWVKSESESRLS